MGSELEGGVKERRMDKLICDGHVTLKNLEYKSRLDFWDDGAFSISYEKERPSWWWRMWQYLLLGWRWTKLA